MKIAYKALYHKALDEKEALLHKVDKLVEENIKLRNKLEYRTVSIALLIASMFPMCIYWLVK